MNLEAKIAEKLQDTADLMLQGAALDYTAYASLVARYRVLQELTEFSAEQRAAAAAGDHVDEDD